MFDRLAHADWSVDPRKRWVATARRSGREWAVEAPALLGSTEAFLGSAFEDAGHQRLLLGFDFPIGMPSAYGATTGFDGFRHILPELGNGAWRHFFDVAESPGEVSATRPFYPKVSRKGVSRDELVRGLGVRSFDDLLRACEKRTEYRQAACALFWTLGGNQVGKAALSGWRDVVRPTVLRGARLWPFDGDLTDLSKTPGVVLAETYPAEAYRMVGAGFSTLQSKRRGTDRQEKSGGIFSWAARHGVSLSASAVAAVSTGFGPSPGGEDPFDAMMGLFKMIEVAEGRRPEATEQFDEVWEGWILGR
jgi:hypothetical protein